eukprot:3389667-Prymnesium_polylepis.1
MAIAASVQSAGTSQSPPSASPPATSSPARPRPMGSSVVEARQLMECPICFEDLSADACAVFTLNNRRVCSHIIHHQCALDLPQKVCPLCRVEFGTAARVPKLEEDPEGWFRLLDIEGEDRLDKSQVLQVLLTQFPLDVVKFEASLNELWPKFDTKKTGFVSRDDFFAPGRGLLDYARKNLADLSTPRINLGTVPDIRCAPQREAQRCIRRHLAVHVRACGGRCVAVRGGRRAVCAGRNGASCAAAAGTPARIATRHACATVELATLVARRIDASDAFARLGLIPTRAAISSRHTGTAVTAPPPPQGRPASVV